MGGMASIYLAKKHGVEGFEKHVVTKTILEHLSSNREFIDMFLDEARIAAKLNHPNIVQIFDLGKIDNIYFIAMEYIHGENWRGVQRILNKQGRLMPLQHVIKSLSQACEGLYYAHNFMEMNGQRMNIVHRDISPQNILLSFDGIIKIVDFGIAKAAGKMQHTRTGVLKGKYSYMSPEQVKGDNIDHRSDLFSLGIILWELITGKKLFPQGNSMAVMRAVVENEIPPPTQYNPQCPGQLERVCLTMLEKDPDRRYQSASEIHVALENLLKDLGLISSPMHLSAFNRELFSDRLKKLIPQRESEIIQTISSDKLEEIVFEGVVSNKIKPAEISHVDSVSEKVKPPPINKNETDEADPDKQIELSRYDSNIHEPKKKGFRLMFGLSILIGLIMLILFVYNEFGFDFKKYFNDKDIDLSHGTSENQNEIKNNNTNNRNDDSILSGANDIEFNNVAQVNPKIKGTLKISSMPETANVYLDWDRVARKTPFVVKNVSHGEHYLQIKKRGYEEWATTFEINENGQVISKNALLQPKKSFRYGNLKVLSYPSGANVLLNDQEIGKTPVVIDNLPVDPLHTLVLKKNDYKKAERNIKLKPGIVNTASFQLAKVDTLNIGFSDFDIKSAPPGAKVYLNNNYIGSTPLTHTVLGGRKYSIELVKAGYTNFLKSVYLKANKKYSIDEKLKLSNIEGSSGIIEIYSEPGCEVEIDESYVGQTPLTGIQKLPGTYSIQLSNRFLGLKFVEVIVLKERSKIKINKVFKKGRIQVSADNESQIFGYLNDKSLGKVPFKIPKEVYEGNYTLKLINELEGIQKEQQIVIEPGKLLNVKAKF